MTARKPMLQKEKREDRVLTQIQDNTIVAKQDSVRSNRYRPINYIRGNGRYTILYFPAFWHNC